MVDQSEIRTNNPSVREAEESNAPYITRPL
jgi:hypothetical protein